MLTTDDIKKLRTGGERYLRLRHRGLPEATREDVLQDCLIALVDNEATITDHQAWLRWLLDKRAASAGRKQARQPVPAGDVNDLSVLGQGTTTTKDAIFAADFDRAIRTLDPELLDAFILYELRGLSQYEAAQVLGISGRAVVSRAEAARTALRKELQ
jgi:RNA polymerase sigma factor (sigma-70 family)